MKKNVPFSRLFGTVEGPKKGSNQAQNGLIALVCAPQIVHDHTWQNEFLTHFWSQNGAFSRLLGFFHGPKCFATGSKWAKNTCLSIPNGPALLLEKCIFGPFLTHLWSQNGPFSRHCGIVHGPKHVTTGSKRAKNILLSTPSGLGTTLEFRSGDPGGPTVGPHCARPVLPSSWHQVTLVRGSGHLVARANAPSILFLGEGGPSIGTSRLQHADSVYN